MNSLLKSLLLAFGAGSFYALAYPSFLGPSFLLLLFIAIPAILFVLENETSLKNRFLFVFVFNLGLNVTGFYWVPHTLREFGQLPFAVSWLLGALFSLILQPHWWLYPLWQKYRPNFKWNSETGMILTAVVLTLLERYVPQQFPIFVGSPWFVLAPHLKLASIFGVSVFSFLTYWIGLETVRAIRVKKVRPLVLMVLGFFILGNRLDFSSPSQTIDHLNVRIVQANVGNFMKVSSEKGDEGSIQSINKMYSDLSLTKNNFKPGLIVWPETAYPDTFFGHKTIIDPLFKNILQETGAELLIGGYDQDPAKSPFDFYETLFNSSILISDNAVKATYHKNILIPFGETLPFGPLNRKIVEIVPAVSLFARGTGTSLMQTREGHRFVTPICYEVLETDYMRSLLNQYGENRFIVNHTNDSWYGNTAEPHQHLFLSKWRALEFNLPIIRSTNTGVTSVIFADGSESKQMGIGEQGILDVKVPLGSGIPTLYQRFGVFNFLGVVLLLGLITWVKEKKKNLL